MGEKSDTEKIEIGVGQGTILGPCLFNLYIHDLVRSIDCKTIQFADDTTILITATNEQELKQKVEEQLNKLFVWFQRNGLTINPDKTRFMQFNGKRITVSLCNKIITRCGANESEKSFNLLGIELDEKLNWLSHLDKILNKVKKGTFTLYKYRYILPSKTKVLLYNSFIMPHLRYGISLWGKVRNSIYGKLRIQNKKALRNLCTNRIHTERIQKEFKLLKIEDIYTYEMSIKAWKYNKELVPISMSDFLQRRNIGRNLRRSNETVTPRSLSTHDNIQYDIKICNYVNDLKNDLKNLTKIEHVKRKLKTQILHRYNMEVNCTSPTCKECITSNV